MQRKFNTLELADIFLLGLVFLSARARSCIGLWSNFQFPLTWYSEDSSRTRCCGVPHAARSPLSPRCLPAWRVQSTSPAASPRRGFFDRRPAFLASPPGLRIGAWSAPPIAPASATIASGAITASSIAADAITAAKVAPDVGTEIACYP